MQKTALCNRNAATYPAQCVALFSGKTAGKKAQSFRLITQTLLVMKLILIFLLAGLLRSNASGFSQTVSFSGKNVAVTNVFKAIEKQTGYSVFANKALLKNTHPVTVSAKEMPLRDFLDLALRDQPIGYEIYNRTIFIKAKTINLQGENQTADPPVEPEDIFAEITGIVQDEDGKPLEGPSVTLKGSTTSTATNAQGRYTINARANDVLVFSFVGYETIEVSVGTNTTINVTLKKSSLGLDQVV